MNGLIGLAKRHKNLLIGLVLGLVTLVVIVATLGDVGLTWDEPLYIKASRGYMSWLGLLRRDPVDALSDAVIVRWWVQDPTLELHPPLGKLLSGFTWAAFRNLIGDISAHRLANAGLFSLLVAMVYWMVSKAYDTPSGAFAALALLLMPRMFLHGHLANIDTTVAITWFLAVYLFWLLQARVRRISDAAACSNSGSEPDDAKGSAPHALSSMAIVLPALVTGVAFGLALATKMNAVVLPIVWLAWLVAFDRSPWSMLRLALIGLVGLVTFVGSWPWLYHETLNRLIYYFFMASRFKDRPQYYLGEVLPHVPWHYPLVITVAVVPLIIIVLAALGTLRILRSKPADRTGWLFILNAALPLLVAALGIQAAYSGERHFIPAYPYLACLAGVGFGHLAKILAQAWNRARRTPISRWTWRWIWLALLMLLLPTAVTIARLHPYELSYYSESVDGIKGAATIGLETTFWCETYRDSLPYLNQNAAPGASVWVENPYVLRLYQRSDMLREDLKITGGDTVSPFDADLAVVQMRQTGFAYTPEVLDLLKDRAPVYTLSRFGVPLMHIFRIEG